MSNILIFREDHDTFDKNLIINVLKDIPLVKSIRKSAEIKGSDSIDNQKAPKKLKFHCHPLFFDVLYAVEAKNNV